MATALQVADYFLAVAPEHDITNLKLQKLCAYAQGVSLAYYNRPLFNERIEAWTHGPVVQEIYNEFANHGSASIPPRCSEAEAFSNFSETESFLLHMIWTTYGRFTAWALRDQSHWDFPGIFGSKKEINQEDIKKAFINNKLVKKMRQNDILNESVHELEV